MKRFLRRLFPLTRTGAALWAWRNRSLIAGWGRFGARAARDGLRGDDRTRHDLAAEARLRAKLTADSRTRGEPIEVRVSNGVATLSGHVPHRAHAAAQEAVADTKGVRRVKDELRNTDRRRRRAA